MTVIREDFAELDSVLRDSYAHREIAGLVEQVEDATKRIEDLLSAVQEANGPAVVGQDTVATEAWQHASRILLARMELHDKLRGAAEFLLRQGHTIR